MNDPKIFKNLEIYSKFYKIIIENKIVKNNNIRAYISKNKTNCIVCDYLKNNKDENYEILLNLLKNKKVKFNRKSCNNVDLDKQVITVKYSKTVDDLFTLANLFSRYISLSNDESVVSNLFSEVFPLVEEFRIYEYIKNSDKELSIDAKRQMNNNILKNIDVAKNAKFELEFYNMSKKLKYVDFDSFDYDLYNYLMWERSDCNNIDKYGIHLFGYVISAYISQMLKNGELSKNDYVLLRNKISELSIKEVSEVLGLNIKTEDDSLFIPDRDLEKLNKVYKKEIIGYNAR